MSENTIQYNTLGTRVYTKYQNPSSLDPTNAALAVVPTHHITLLLSLLHYVRSQEKKFKKKRHTCPIAPTRFQAWVLHSIRTRTRARKLSNLTSLFENVFLFFFFFLKKNKALGRKEDVSFQSYFFRHYTLEYTSRAFWNHNVVKYVT
jgi:hypothetical protein